MKDLKKSFVFSRLLFATLFFSLILSSCASIPKLSKAEKQIITDVVKSPIPESITGKTGFANSQGHNIWFESIEPKSESKGSVILIMGNGSDAFAWPPNFISNLVSHGYQVIRYDHRGTGLSTSKEKWKKKKAYSLNDMSNDVIAILDTLQIKKAHIVGASMGGMIGQIVAVENPKKTASLTSIMSTGDAMDPVLPQMSDEVVPKMVSAILKHGFFGGKKGQIKRQLIQKRILMGNASGEIDTKTIAETTLYNLKKREGYNLMSARHHFEAISNATSRYVQLSRIDIPTLVIHGNEDPVIPILHSEKLVKIIPNAESLWIQNMGHDLPDAAINQMTDKMILNFERSANY
jgi:proline iminopeptidase